jgi:type VI secretion system protein VasD
MNIAGGKIAVYKLMLCVSLMLTIAGCGLFSKPPAVVKPPPPTVVKGKIEVSLKSNPDGNGKPSPVVVRIYELKDASSFAKADFDKLYPEDAQVLAADLLLREERILRPGEQHVISPREVQKDTRFLAVFAAYRDLDRATWRAVLAVPQNRTTTFTVNVGALAISLVEDKP